MATMTESHASLTGGADETNMIIGGINCSNRHSVFPSVEGSMTSPDGQALLLRDKTHYWRRSVAGPPRRYDKLPAARRQAGPIKRNATKLRTRVVEEQRAGSI